MSLTLLGVGGPGWNPTKLGAALITHWSADDHGTANMTDDGAGLISSFVDRVGGLTLSGATTQRPTWNATSFNSAFAGLTFNGSLTELVAAASVGSMPVGTTEGWIFGLISPTDTATATCAFGYGAQAINAARRIQKSNADLAQVADNTAIAAGPVMLGPHVIVGQFGAAGTQINGWLDGTAFSGNPTTATFNTTGTRTRMGGNANAALNQAFDGVIRHIIVTSAVSTGQRQSLEGWLKGQGGI